MKKTPTSQINREIAAVVARSPLASSSDVDALLDRLADLESRYRRVGEELRAAARQADDVDREATEHAVRPERRAAAERRWTEAQHAERALTSQMREIVLEVRSIDPARVPRRWQNTQ